MFYNFNKGLGDTEALQGTDLSRSRQAEPTFALEEESLHTK
jgi:hypothetical protein